MATEQPAPKKSSLSISRVILLLILVVALAALGYDQYSKYQMGQMFDTLEQLSKEAENSSLGLPKDKVREKLGREPTRTSSTGFQEVEEYDFPGVFYVHRVTVRYRAAIKGGKDVRAPYDDHSKESIFRISGG